MRRIRRAGRGRIGPRRTHRRRDRPGDAMSIKATAFHARVADANRSNSWVARNGFTLVREYSGAHEEALAARLGTVLADISWRWRIILEGARAAEFLSRLTTRDAGVL